MRNSSNANPPPLRRTRAGKGPVAGLLLLLCISGAAAPACGDPEIRRTADYRYAIGSATFSDPAGAPEQSSAFRWLTNGVLCASGPVAEGLLLNFDGAVGGANGETPTSATGVDFASGPWGSALALSPSGLLRFPVANQLAVDEGTVELWAALRQDGTNAAYAARSHVLFHYRAANGDYLQIAQSGSSGILYAGGTVQGQWESAYGSGGQVRGWRAGEWHHLAFTYSARSNFMRFYVDGHLAAANNEGHYWAPAADGAGFAVGGDLSSRAADYWIDAFRASGRVVEPEELAARAGRTDPPRANEVWLPLAGVPLGQALSFEFTPATAAGAGAPCTSAPWSYDGVPVFDPQPPSTLLPAGATSLDLEVETTAATSCAYAIGQPLAYAQMTPFDAGAGGRRHGTRLAGLNPDPQIVNDVYVRCAAQPEFLLRLRYRALSAANPPFPRTGNLWGWGEWRPKGLAYMAKVDLWLGAQPPASEIRELRRLNPHVRLLTSINAVENGGLPPDYYLKDVRGQRIEVWPGSFRLNLTKPYVAEYQARFAYDTVLATELLADGVFFDNVMTTQSWQQQDIYGNPVQIDADENGVADDPAAFDAAWKAGVFREIRAFRALMPHAIVNGHSMNIDEPGIAELFNGISLGFVTANVLEGEESFGAVWNRYAAWHARAVQPAAVMVESSPVDQIAYGYDYAPWEKIPPSTLDFARAYFPHVRFGLALTLMQDGYFAHEYGDTWHGNDWWYDELDFELGYPLGPAQRVPVPGTEGTNLLVNGDFAAAIASPWRFSVGTGCTAALVRETNATPAGSAVARVDIAAATGTDWHIEFAQYGRALEQGVAYDFRFRAKSSAPRSLTVGAQRSSPDWRNYGLWGRVHLTNDWQSFTVPFTANETVTDARLQFFLAETNGTVWLADVSLARHPPDIYRRDFTHGIVLLNGTTETRDLAVGPGFKRLTGSQAPLIERLVDDRDAGFSVTGAWTNAAHDSGEWKAAGPFYHSWAGALHERLDATGEAQWILPVERDDTYTLAAWWPAAPAANQWAAQARYEVRVDGQVLAVAELDQRAAGDQWHPFATVPLASTQQVVVRLTAPAGGCVADALWLRSASRFNNGLPAETVRLQPRDGILLAREHPAAQVPRLDRLTASLGQLTLAVEQLTPGLTTELQRSPGLFPAEWTVRQSFLPTGYNATLLDPADPNAPSGFYRLRVP